MRVMDTPYISIVNIYDDLLSIECSYVGRIQFCRNELYKLKLNYASFAIDDKEYFKKLCPLNMEKKNINMEYRNDISKYAETIPSIYFFQEMIDEFEKDLI